MSQWFRSDRVRKLFSYSSWAVVCMGTGILVLFVLSPWSQQIEAMPRAKLLLQVLGGVVGVVGAPASIVIWLGMMAFCLREDRSSLSTRIFWFILFFTTAWFGAAAYFFKVYRRQVQGTIPAST